MTRTLRLSQQHIREILDHARSQYPHEACGLIAGKDGTAFITIAMKNVSSTPQAHFSMEPNELLQQLKRIDHEQQALLAIYHTHPSGEPIPSPTDIAEAQLNTPNLNHLIIGLKHNDARLKLWHMSDNRVYPVQLLIGNQKAEAHDTLTNSQKYAIIFAALLSIVILLTISFSLLPPAPPISPVP